MYTGANLWGLRMHTSLTPIHICIRFYVILGHMRGPSGARSNNMRAHVDKMLGTFSNNMVCTMYIFSEGTVEYSVTAR